MCLKELLCLRLLVHTKKVLLAELFLSHACNLTQAYETTRSGTLAIPGSTLTDQMTMQKKAELTRWSSCAETIWRSTILMSAKLRLASAWGLQWKSFAKRKRAALASRREESCRKIDNYINTLMPMLRKVAQCSIYGQNVAADSSHHQKQHCPIECCHRYRLLAKLLLWASPTGPEISIDILKASRRLHKNAQIRTTSWAVSDWVPSAAARSL